MARVPGCRTPNEMAAASYWISSPYFNAKKKLITGQEQKIRIARMYCMVF
jgi:hypothetical protein